MRVGSGSAAAACGVLARAPVGAMPVGTLQVALRNAKCHVHVFAWLCMSCLVQQHSARADMQTYMLNGFELKTSGKNLSVKYTGSF